MIDRRVFESQFLLLQERFTRDFTAPVIAEYYRLLCDRMTTAEFTAACEACFFGDEFFPTPERILTRVHPKPDPQRAAFEAWEKVLSAACDVRSGVALDEIGATALASVGGLHRVGYADSSRLEWIRKDFVAVYLAEFAAKQTSAWRALPSASQSVA